MISRTTRLVLVACMAASYPGGAALAHADKKAPRAGVIASTGCVDERPAAPKPTPKPRPETAPARDRPPSSLPCCKGADCTCSGPPALAATPGRVGEPASPHA